MQRKMGRPTNYDNEKMPIRAYKLALLGLTNEQLAIAFGIGTSTFKGWMERYPDFQTAIKNGKEEADHNVAKSLYQRALGFEHPAEEIKVINGEVVRIPITKQYPPDTTACIFWLKNRQRDNWRDVWRLEHTGPDGNPIDVKLELSKLDLSDLTDEELMLAEKLSGKLTNGNGNGKS